MELPTDASNGRLLFTAREAASALAISYAQVYREIMSGRLRSLKVGRRRLISKTAIADFIAAMEREESRT